MATIRLYRPVKEDWISSAIHYIGGFFGHEVQLSHCSFEWDGGITDFTNGGLGYYTITEEADYRTPDVILYLNAMTFNENDDLYVRSMVFAQCNVKLTVGALLKKLLRLDMRVDELLCTDYVQVVLGDEPQHFVPIELIQHYIPHAYKLSVTPYGLKALEDGNICTAHILLEVRE